MGGSRGRGSCSSWTSDQSDFGMLCQICEDPSHEALDCPFIYSACRKCKGMRRVWRSKTAKNFNKKFLKCSRQPKCPEFEWLDDAIQHSVSFGPPPQHMPSGCFKCGEPHWLKDCPNQPSPSKPSPKYTAASPSPKKAVSSSKLEAEDEVKSPSMSPATPANLVIQTTLGELYERMSAGLKME